MEQEPLTEVEKTKRTKYVNLGDGTCIHYIFSQYTVYSLICYMFYVQDDTEEEPFEIAISWDKFALVPYTTLGESAAVARIIESIEDEQDTNWELKV